MKDLTAPHVVYFLEEIERSEHPEVTKAIKDAMVDLDNFDRATLLCLRDQTRIDLASVTRADEQSLYNTQLVPTIM